MVTTNSDAFSSVASCSTPGAADTIFSVCPSQESRRRDQDPLHGRRVHFWVLVLAGSRSVDEHFFIDPLSGKSYSSDNDHFLGVESVWNNLNYYINMQDCSYGCDVSVHHADTHTLTHIQG